MAERLTYDDYLRRLNIQDVLMDAGYTLNRRDGLRYPSYVRLDGDGRRIRGDKFIVTQGGKCCFQPPEQKVYNVISFIKEHPELFAEHRMGVQPDRLVNLVCCRLLNEPVEERTARIVEPKKEVKPFRISDYGIHRFDTKDRESQKRFYPYFKFRGIDLYTQYAFHRHFCLATKHRTDGLSFANLAFPLSLPKEPEKTVGFEERGRPKMDGSSGYKGKAEGSNGSEGLWIANLTGKPLEKAEEILWFESSYDAMAEYQINPQKSVFVSTGGTPTEGQIRSMLAVTPNSRHYLGFDKDDAGRQFVSRFKQIAAEMGFRKENVQAYHPSGCYKDWNDALLNRKSAELISKGERDCFDYGEFMKGKVQEPKQRSTTMVYRFVLILILSLFGANHVQAQLTASNPLEWMALAEGNEAINGEIEKQIKGQTKTAMLQNTIAAEFTKIHDWEKKYNSYLKTANGYASSLKACTHLYDDGVKIFLTLGKLQKAISNNPQGIVASISMNNLYMETATELVSVFNLLNDAVAKGGKENMLTGAERSKTLWALNDKLSGFSKKLHQLYLSIRYYTMNDVWNCVTAGMIDRSNGDIARQALGRWRRSAAVSNRY